MIATISMALISGSGDPDSKVSFGCVWSRHRPWGDFDCRLDWENCGERGPDGVFWGVVLFEDRSCLVESRFWHGAAVGPVLPVAECFVEVV